MKERFETEAEYRRFKRELKRVRRKHYWLSIFEGIKRSFRHREKT